MKRKNDKSETLIVNSLMMTYTHASSATISVMLWSFLFLTIFSIPELLCFEFFRAFCLNDAYYDETLVFRRCCMKSFV